MTAYELLKRAAAGDKEAKEQLVKENSGMIYLVVNRFRHRGAEPDDLFQVASIGFLKALERFDVSLGLQFSTYAIPVMMGEVKRYLRDNAPIKVSRSYKELSGKAALLREQLMQKSGQEPTLKELATALNVEPEELAAALCATRPPESLEELRAGSDISLLDTVATGEEMHILDQIAIRELIDSLPEREQKIILLRYIKELTQTQVASMLGISQVQVSRLEKKILQKLKIQLSA
ncbi:MAG: SigB/SigF/SigG family RNA polymerase sigma factor [Ruminococcaceae bacterium]|nr:SigB/SigF/SigG family RNA polymerase sigma factor [Oscillospiraceae bacterium]